MKKIDTNPNSSINVTNGNTEYGQFGLTKIEHMSIEFTKALILSKFGSYDSCIKHGIICANSLIKSLNELK